MSFLKRRNYSSMTKKNDELIRGSYKCLLSDKDLIIEKSTDCGFSTNSAKILDKED